MASHICIIGDSHAAALKEGWDAMGDTGRTLTFFAAALPLLEHLAVDKGRLVADDKRLAQHFARSSGGRTEIGGDYDGYIVCGQGVGFGRIQYVYRYCRMPGLAPDENVAQLSRSAFEAALDDHMGKARAVRTLEILRQITRAPTLLIAMPLPARERAPQIWDKLDARGDRETVLTLYRESCARLAARHGAVFLPQPHETLAEDGTTRIAFAREAARLSGAAKDDLYHMNGAYGEIVVRAALAAL